VSERLYERFEPEVLDALSDAELDALPFGVLALAPGGIVARYNLAEARFARLDRQQVKGRSFFGEIARCTATPEFQGRYDALMASDQPGSVQFEYVFAFRFGAQRVSIDMGRARGSPLVYACINRKKFLPRREDVPASVEAPLLAELEPEAEHAQVRRDTQGRRRIDLEVTFLDALLRSVPDRNVHREIGTSWGRYAVVDLETETLERDGVTLSDRSMADAMATVARFVQRQQLGRVTFDFSLARRGGFSIDVVRSVLAEALVAPGCGLFEGLFGAILSHLASRPIVVREVMCRAARVEGATCSFVAVAADRAPSLERACAARPSSVASLFDWMARESLDAPG